MVRDVTEIRPVRFAGLVPGTPWMVRVELADGTMEDLPIGQIQCLATRRDDATTAQRHAGRVGKAHPYAANWLAIWRLASEAQRKLARAGHRTSPDVSPECAGMG